MELNDLLTTTAQRIDAEGTRSEAAALEILAAAVRDTAPGAAAALVDWDGTEIARQRAFGIVHGLLLHALNAHGRELLLLRLDPLAAAHILVRAA
ncbi:hypothetical protein [Sinomonas halotolerans]|uniref:Uncharacterized protein n=1 Tax=Sinomonas halotolerans TaxID=1644133 RepID=A0ABU9WYI5_9MICC